MKEKVLFKIRIWKNCFISMRRLDDEIYEEWSFPSLTSAIWRMITKWNKSKGYTLNGDVFHSVLFRICKKGKPYEIKIQKLSAFTMKHKID